MEDLITSARNPKIKRAVSLQQSKRRRDAAAEFVLEGARLCADAAVSGTVIKEAFITEDAAARYPAYVDRISAAALRSYRISEEAAAKLADTENPQGVFCVCSASDRIRFLEKPDGAFDKNGAYIAFENLQNPGNLGAAARTAEAFGLSGMIISGGADIFSPKAQRAAMGALLRLAVYKTDDLPASLAGAASAGMNVYAALPGEGSAPVTEIRSRPGGVIAVVGNEGSGLTGEVIRACGRSVTIPMRGRAESLNAAEAAAVIMWEMVR